MNAHFAPRVAEALVYLGLGVGMVVVQVAAPAQLDTLLDSAVFESVTDSNTGGSNVGHCDTSGGTLSWSPGGNAATDPAGSSASGARPGFDITGLGGQCAAKRLQVTLRDSAGRVLGTAHGRVSSESRGGGHRANFVYPALDAQGAEISSVQVHVTD